MPRTPAHILDFARRGAAARVRELTHELDLLLNLFPDLADAFDPDELPVAYIVGRDAWRESGKPAKGALAPGAARPAARRRTKREWGPGPRT